MNHCGVIPHKINNPTDSITILEDIVLRRSKNKLFGALGSSKLLINQGRTTISD
jgi:hypothetical protein